MKVYEVKIEAVGGTSWTTAWVQDYKLEGYGLVLVHIQAKVGRGGCVEVVPWSQIGRVTVESAPPDIPPTAM